MKRNSGTARRFALSLAATLLFAVGASGILLSLQRMEQTMNGGRYTLFSLQKEPGDQLDITALEHRFSLDFSALRGARDRLAPLAPLAPPEWRLFGTAVSGTADWLCQWFASL